MKKNMSLLLLLVFCFLSLVFSGEGVAGPFVLATDLYEASY